MDCGNSRRDSRDAEGACAGHMPPAEAAGEAAVAETHSHPHRSVCMNTHHVRRLRTLRRSRRHVAHLAACRRYSDEQRAL